MLNVLLADDETRTLHHLMTGVPWFQLGMEVCCTASNGSEALAFIESHPIDILITDIRMPLTDGLSLIERALKLQPNLHSVIVSGYEDFHYAREAIRLNVLDYLTKPIDETSILSMLLLSEYPFAIAQL